MLQRRCADSVRWIDVSFRDSPPCFLLFHQREKLTTFDFCTLGFFVLIRKNAFSLQFYYF